MHCHRNCAKLLRQPPVLPVLVAESFDAEPRGATFKLGYARFATHRDLPHVACRCAPTPASPACA